MSRFLNYAQRVCVWLVALAMTKLAKRNEPVGNSVRNFQVGYNQQLVIHVVVVRFFDQFQENA